jgi:hypothetical protein
MNETSPIQDCMRQCTADERAAIEARMPPYDGVRTWGDLLVVRGRLGKKDKNESRS